MPYKSWIAPKDITFSREQLEGFLLPNLYLLKVGEYPIEDVESGYENESQRRPAHSDAYYVTACGIAAEIGARLNRCGRYRQIIYKLHCSQKTRLKKIKRQIITVPYYNEDQLSREFNMNGNDFDILHDRLLTYISGWQRKLISFQAWNNRLARPGF